jgi:hypothetical protein
MHVNIEFQLDELFELLVDWEMFLYECAPLRLLFPIKTEQFEGNETGSVDVSYRIRMRIKHFLIDTITNQINTTI